MTRTRNVKIRFTRLDGLDGLQAPMHPEPDPFSV